MIEVTDTRIDLMKNGKVLAYATVTINDSIVISGIRLYEGNKGKFIVFPTRRSKKGKTFDITFPCKDEVRELILQEIEMKYLDEVFK